MESSSTATTASNSSSSRGVKHDDQDDAALDDIRRYEDFTTVDWIVDSSRERARIARERSIRAVGSNGASSSSNAHLANGWGRLGYGRGERPPRWWPMMNPWGRRAWWAWCIVKKAADAATDSGVVVLVGILIGMNMAVISIATEWASDLKQGYCSAGWWLNQKFCCWELMDDVGPGGSPTPSVLKAGVAAAIPHVNTSLLTTSASAHPTLKRSLGIAYQVLARAHPLLEGRADAKLTATLDVPAVCADWVPWSTWSFPAWIVYVLFAAALSFACAHLVRSFAPYAAGSGIPEIKCILAGFVINGYLGIWTFLIKSLTLPLAIASGLSVGKEGPAVHVACCIGNIVGRCFKSFDRSQARMRELLTAASAAGVAVAFGSPIGGVLFSLEEMAYNFPASTMWRSFLCALAATVTLSFMNPFRTGKLVLFQVSYDRDWHYFEILFYIIIGVFGGLYGAFVIKYNLQVQNFRRNNLAAYGVSEAVTLAVLTALVGYFNMFLRIDMTESLEILFRECEGGGDYDNLCQSSAQWRMVNSLFIATMLRAVLVVISYGCKVPAGIFVPSMAIGATFGRLVGILVKALYNAAPNASIFSACQPDVPCITPGTYAFLGAAAALAGVTRITVAVVVIMFELTGALTYILPTMIVIMITKGVGDLYGKGGISEQMIKFQGYPFLDHDDHTFGIPVQDVMKRAPESVSADGSMQLGQLETKLATGNYKGLPVVAGPEDDTLVGYVGKRELRYALGKARHARALGPTTRCLFTLGADGPRPRAYSMGLGAAEPSPMFGQQEMREAQEEGIRGAASLGVSRVEEERGLMPEDEEEEDGDGADPLGDASGGVDGEGDEDTVELGGWVDQTPLIVQPIMPLETVMDLFKKMGPRVILVAQYGQLQGLVTVKDLLKHVAAQERAAAIAAQAALSLAHGPALPGVGSSPGTAGGPHRQTSQDDGPHFDSFGNELELLLSDAWEWARARAQRVRPLLSRMGLGRRGAGGAASHPAPGGVAMRTRGGEGRYAQVPDENDGETDRTPPRSPSGGRARLEETQHFALGDDD